MAVTPQEWIAQMDAPDMSLKAARAAYHTASEGEHREALLHAIVRAERRLAVRYAPGYVAQMLGGCVPPPALEGEEYDAFYQAIERGE